MKIYLSLAVGFFLNASSLHANITTAFYPGYKSPGNTFYTLTTDSRESCAAACLSKEFCSLAVFNDLTYTCRLKSRSFRYESAESRTLILKIIAGQDNIDYIKGDYTSFTTPTWESCSRACFVDAQCKAFTFNKTTHACWLKTKIVYTEINPNAISGVR